MPRTPPPLQHNLPLAAAAAERLYPWLLDWVAASAAAPPAAALRALRKLSHQLLLAVACLHNRGVVHADIKPDNLLLCGPPGGWRVCGWCVAGVWMGGAQLADAERE
jgi:Ser/Thr protein kinase RdoA (MazF antagonist)